MIQIISIFHHHIGSHPWLGDILVVGSAACAAIYMVMYARYFIKQNTTTTPFTQILLWLGTIGTMCATCTWPMLILLHYMKWEEFHWPDGSSYIIECHVMWRRVEPCGSHVMR